MELSKLYPLREDIRFVSKRFSEDNQASVLSKMSDIDFRIDGELIEKLAFYNNIILKSKLKIDPHEMALTMRKLKSQIEALEEFLNEEIHLAQNK